MLSWKKICAANAFIARRPPRWRRRPGPQPAPYEASGLGGVVEQGWDQVAARLDWASANYAEGDRSNQVVRRFVAGDVAYLVRKEIIEARIGDAGAGRSRQELRELNDHLLKDIGLSRDAVACEVAKPFWR